MVYYTRLIYNSQNWQLPSGPIGKCGDENSRLWEYTAGFGFEEWYRNPKFEIKDENGVNWQYGYWQCFKTQTSIIVVIIQIFKFIRGYAIIGKKGLRTTLKLQHIMR